jgi:hypothetical protein
LDLIAGVAEVRYVSEGSDGVAGKDYYMVQDGKVVLDGFEQSEVSDGSREAY